MKYPLTCLEGNNNLAFVSVPLRPFVGDTALGMGTGFLFQPEFERIFLITNRHLVIEETNVCVRARPWLTARVEASGFVRPRRSG
jgi:hypothetical protein